MSKRSGWATKEEQHMQEQLPEPLHAMARTESHNGRHLTQRRAWFGAMQQRVGATLAVVVAFAAVVGGLGCGHRSGAPTLPQRSPRVAQAEQLVRKARQVDYAAPMNGSRQAALRQAAALYRDSCEAQEATSSCVWAFNLYLRLEERNQALRVIDPSNSSLLRMEAILANRCVDQKDAAACRAFTNYRDISDGEALCAKGIGAGCVRMVFGWFDEGFLKRQMDELYPDANLNDGPNRTRYWQLVGELYTQQLSRSCDLNYATGCRMLVAAFRGPEDRNLGGLVDRLIGTGNNAQLDALVIKAQRLDELNCKHGDSDACTEWLHAIYTATPPAVQHAIGSPAYQRFHAWADPVMQRMNDALTADCQQGYLGRCHFIQALAYWAYIDQKESAAEHLLSQPIKESECAITGVNCYDATNTIFSDSDEDRRELPASELKDHRNALEHGCQHGDLGDCNRLIEYYRDTSLPEPVPGRADTLSRWVAAHDSE